MFQLHCAFPSNAALCSVHVIVKLFCTHAFLGREQYSKSWMAVNFCFLSIKYHNWILVLFYFFLINKSIAQLRSITIKQIGSNKEMVMMFVATINVVVFGVFKMPVFFPFTRKSDTEYNYAITTAYPVRCFLNQTGKNIINNWLSLIVTIFFYHMITTCWPIDCIISNPCLLPHSLIIIQ